MLSVGFVQGVYAASTGGAGEPEVSTGSGSQPFLGAGVDALNTTSDDLGVDSAAGSDVTVVSFVGCGSGDTVIRRLDDVTGVPKPGSSSSVGHTNLSLTHLCLTNTTLDLRVTLETERTPQEIDQFGPGAPSAGTMEITFFPANDGGIFTSSLVVNYDVRDDSTGAILVPGLSTGPVNSNSTGTPWAHSSSSPVPFCYASQATTPAARVAEKHCIVEVPDDNDFAPGTLPLDYYHIGAGTDTLSTTDADIGVGSAAGPNVFVVSFAGCTSGDTVVDRLDDVNGDPTGAGQGVGQGATRLHLAHLCLFNETFNLRVTLQTDRTPAEIVAFGPGVPSLGTMEITFFARDHGMFTSTLSVHYDVRAATTGEILVPDLATGPITSFFTPWEISNSRSVTSANSFCHSTTAAEGVAWVLERHCVSVLPNPNGFVPGGGPPPDVNPPSSVLPPPYFPTPNTTPPGPQVQDCNRAGANELGHNGNSAGSSTGYHTYANIPGFAAGDYCATLSPSFFAQCTQDTFRGAIANFTTSLGNPVPPDVANLTAARRGLTTEAQNWASGQTCDGILGTGSDGEYEFGGLTAVLNVRDNGGITDNAPTQGGASTTKGSDVKDCINPKASNHHGSNTDIYVLDVIYGGINFTVDGDWSRPNWLGFGGNDENDNPSPGQCGGDGVEPCAFYAGGTGGSDPDIVSGRESADGELVALASQAQANGASLAGLAKTLEYEGGCNPLDFSFPATGGHFSVTSVSNVCGAASLAALSSRFDYDYTGGAAGFIVVNIDGSINGGTAGWVWTG